MKKSSFCRKLGDRRRILYGNDARISAHLWVKSLLSGLFHVFEVNIFTLVFGEDLFLLPSGVRIARRTLAVLLRSTALLVGVLSKALLLCAGVVAVGVVVEADSEKGENEVENTPENDGKEDDEAYNEGKKTSESIDHTAKVYG